MEAKAVPGPRHALSVDVEDWYHDGELAATGPGPRVEENTDTLLELYALFKQGTAGDVCGPRPGWIDIKGRAKFDAWSGKKGMSQDAAQKAYVALVNRLVGK